MVSKLVASLPRLFINLSAVGARSHLATTGSAFPSVGDADKYQARHSQAGDDRPKRRRDNAGVDVNSATGMQRQESYNPGGKAEKDGNYGGEPLLCFIHYRTYAAGNVIPAFAGIQCSKSLTIVPIPSHYDFWTPAFAGVTGVGFQVRNSYH